MRVAPLLASVVIAILAAGCETTSPYIDVSSTAFRSPSLGQSGTFLVAPLNDEQRTSLEFRTVADQLAQEFARRGYAPPTAEGTADYIAYMTYGIDDGRAVQVAVPIFGRTGGGTTYASGTSSGAGGVTTYNATATTMPTYGVVGAASQTQEKYRRKLAVDVFDARKTPPEKVLEIRTQSDGSCGNIRSVIPTIVRAAVESLGAENGQTVQRRLDWSGDC